MSKVDWSKAPANTEFWSCGFFYKTVNGRCMYFAGESGEWAESAYSKDELIDMHSNFYDKPSNIVDVNKNAWPSESRIDIIGTNGNTAEHYMDEHHEKVSTGPSVYEARKHYETQAELAAKRKTITTASDFLSEGLRILSERGKQYDPSGKKEMSFDNVAEAFNCLTNSRLNGSDVCLLLALLKVVRQNANKEFHEDSAVDFVNYAALHSELVRGEKA